MGLGKASAVVAAGIQRRLSSVSVSAPRQVVTCWGEEKKKKTIQQKFGMLPVSFTCHVVVNLCSADGIAAPIVIKDF